jgi:hypothetical protein
MAYAIAARIPVPNSRPNSRLFDNVSCWSAADCPVGTKVEVKIGQTIYRGEVYDSRFTTRTDEGYLSQLLGTYV